ncbi:MAG: ABC transporter substrate-binding protein [Rhodocyclales bacterium]|nr:ABC transporter substrate-binding protein [Rhodocyclales bacterium]
MKKQFKQLAIAALLAAASAAQADINIGINVSATGSTAVLGGPQKNTVELLPTTLAGEKINWIVLDDASDPTNAAKNVTKLVAENKVDILISGTSTPTVAASATVAAEAKTPLFGLAPASLDGDKHKWTFLMPQHFKLMAAGLLEHMKANNVKTLGFIGFADGYGETWIKVLEPLVASYGVKLEPIERFNRTDTSVTGQTLKLVAAKPDAVLIVASGAPAAMPHLALVEKGYKGQVYQTHGAPSPAYLKIGGKAVEGGVFVAGPLLEWAQLPDSAPTKKTSAEYAKLYEGKYGAGTLSSFGGHLWDAWAVASRAIPVALKKAKPGTPEFRAAVRDAIEGEKEVVGVHGVFNMSPTDHFGHDARARVMLRVDNGAFKIISAK